MTVIFETLNGFMLVCSKPGNDSSGQGEYLVSMEDISQRLYNHRHFLCLHLLETLLKTRSQIVQIISVLNAINVEGKAQARKKGKSRKASKKDKKWKKSQGGRTDKPGGEKKRYPKWKDTS